MDEEHCLPLGRPRRCWEGEVEEEIWGGPLVQTTGWIASRHCWRMPPLANLQLKAFFLIYCYLINMLIYLFTLETFILKISGPTVFQLLLTFPQHVYAELPVKTWVLKQNKKFVCAVNLYRLISHQYFHFWILIEVLSLLCCFLSGNLDSHSHVGNIQPSVLIF